MYKIQYLGMHWNEQIFIATHMWEWNNVDQGHMTICIPAPKHANETCKAVSIDQNAEMDFGLYDVQY